MVVRMALRMAVPMVERMAHNEVAPKAAKLVVMMAAQRDGSMVAVKVSQMAV